MRGSVTEVRRSLHEEIEVVRSETKTTETAPSRSTNAYWNVGLVNTLASPRHLSSSATPGKRAYRRCGVLELDLSGSPTYQDFRLLIHEWLRQQACHSLKGQLQPRRDVSRRSNCRAGKQTRKVDHVHVIS